MNVVDANVLLYALNADSEHHDASRRWLDDALNGAAPVGFAWVVMLAFLRLSTKVGLFPQPLSVTDAIRRLDAWASQPTAEILHPTPRHLGIVQSLLEATGSGGNLVNDAHLGALAIEHRGTVVSFDNDFDRFPGVRWRRP